MEYVYWLLSQLGYSSIGVHSDLLEGEKGEGNKDDNTHKSEALGR